MQRMQRLTGRFLTRTPNEADIEAMLRDFNDAEVMLTKVRPPTSMLCLFAMSKSKVQCVVFSRRGGCEPVGLPYQTCRSRLLVTIIASFTGARDRLGAECVT
jgi:RimJ/RimL family protein N-acetyltransferase